MTFIYINRSIEAFIDAVNNHKSNLSLSNSLSHSEKIKLDPALATIESTYRTTAILEAGRRSLDQNKLIRIVYNDPLHPCRPTELE